MKIIMNVKINEGYEKWKNLFSVLILIEKNMELKF